MPVIKPRTACTDAAAYGFQIIIIMVALYCVQCARDAVKAKHDMFPPSGATVATAAAQITVNSPTLAASRARKDRHTVDFLIVLRPSLITPARDCRGFRMGLSDAYAALKSAARGPAAYF